MKVSDVIELISRYEEDLSLYNTFYKKAYGEHADSLFAKHNEIKTMLDKVKEKLNNSDIENITEDDFKC